jgi:uncharacterized RDD family membrane protein YckC
MYQSSPTSFTTQGPACAEHPQRPAVSICSRCGTYACDACLRVGDDRQDYCFRCLPLTSRPLATPSSRFAANMVDQLAPLLPLYSLALVPKDSDFMPYLAGMAVSLLIICAQLHHVVTHGQSLGKRMLGIKVVRTDGAPIGLGRLLLLRNLLPIVIGMATCNLFSLIDQLFIFGEDRLCLHDRIADTKVVQVRKPTG